MNLTNKGFLDSDDAKSKLRKSTFLNPNAAEFVPSSFQPPLLNTSTSNIYPALPNSLFDSPKSNTPTKSDDAEDYWYSQLPDDITSDYKSELSFTNLSLNDNVPENYTSIDNPCDEYQNDANFNPMEFLTYQFPNFAADSLADVYYANSCDLNMTIEMLTQLELQANEPSPETKLPEPPNFEAHEFPALSSSLTKHNSSPNFLDFASTVRKQPSLQHSTYHKNKSRNIMPSRRTPDVTAVPYNGKSKLPWLETGESVANMYTELRGDARELARVRNTYFEQARQAYIVGNGALAKELSRKGKLFNVQMKEAHEKARETIYRHRNPLSLGTGSQDQLIDLHGLHVSEAIRVLQQELEGLRRVGRAQGKRLHVMICVGTGHHTKGSRTPARLPVAVEQFLVEEGVRFTQPQPGLLRLAL